jgi:hypothetical protein
MEASHGANMSPIREGDGDVEMVMEWPGFGVSEGFGSLGLVGSLCQGVGACRMVRPGGCGERVVIVSSVSGCCLVGPVSLGMPCAGPCVQPSCGVHVRIVLNAPSYRLRRIGIRRHDMSDFACIVFLWPFYRCPYVMHLSSRSALPHVAHHTARFTASIFAQTVTPTCPGRIHNW